MRGAALALLLSGCGQAAQYTRDGATIVIWCVGAGVFSCAMQYEDTQRETEIEAADEPLD